LLLSAPSLALAGPWLREKGRTFSSVSLTATYFRDMGNSAYLEFGLTDKMTIGADVGQFTNRLGERNGFGTIFMRRALGSNDGPNRWAYELGVGTAWVGDLVLPHVKTGLSWGRGIELWDKNGWMTVDAAVIWGISHDQHVGKIDTTVGLNFTDVTTGMLQLYLGHLDNEFYATLAPAVVIKPRKAKFKILIGTEIPMEDTKNTALKLGIWREF
jgi:hypothetical protein